MSIDVIWVNKEDADKVWGSVEPYLKSALLRWLPVYFTCDLLEMVKRDELQLWIITDNDEEKLYGAALTQIVIYPRAKIMNVFMLGGRDWKKWKENISSAMERFAYDQKCDFLQSMGRRGWSYFKGAFESGVILNKVLT